METRENQDNILYRLYLIFGLVSSITGIFLVIFTLTSKTPTLFIIVSTVYFTTVVFFILIFAMRWNSIFHPKFLAAITRSGIKGVYLNSEFPLKIIMDELTRQIDNNTLKNLKIIAYYGYNLLYGMDELIPKAVNAGARVKIIVAESDSEFVKAVNKLESVFENIPVGKREKESSDEQKKAFEILDRLKKIADAAGKNFEYKTYKTEVRYALVAINDEWAWWTPYHPGLKVPQTTSFVLKGRSNSSILWLCIEHFKALWSVL